MARKLPLSLCLLLAACGGGGGSVGGPPALTPRVADVGATPLALAGGAAFTCVATGGADVRCFGANDKGQLGDGTRTARLNAAPVRGLTQANAVAAGGEHACALLTGGDVRCFGANDLGQLGDGSTTMRLAPPTTPAASGAVSLAAGKRHTCAVNSAGEVFCWGANDRGQLGDGTTTARPSAKKVEGLPAATRVFAGANHTCALLQNHTLRCWGANDAGQLGNYTIGMVDTQGPVATLDVYDAADAALGARFSCAQVGNGHVTCWGANDAGQLGDGTTTARGEPRMVTDLATTTGPGTLAAGDAHVCARLAAGGVRCWGANTKGQLGDGSTANRARPVDVPSNLGTVTWLGAGAEHTCAVASESVRCWGSNDRGQLGFKTP